MFENNKKDSKSPKTLHNKHQQVKIFLCSIVFALIDVLKQHIW